jgi:hypothetical protein
MMAMILLDHPKKKKEIKIFLDKAGIPSQFMLLDTVKRAKLTVYTNILKQMNAKIPQDLYRINIPNHMKHTMQIGVDVCQAGRKSIIGLTATYTPFLTQHFSAVYK